MDADAKNFQNGLGFCLFGFAGGAVMSLLLYLVPSMPRAIPLTLLFVFIAMMGIGLVMIFAPERSHEWGQQWHKRRKVLSGPLILMAFGSVIFLIGLFWQIQPEKTTNHEARPDYTPPLSIVDLFNSDFPKFGRYFAFFKINGTLGSNIKLYYNVYYSDTPYIIFSFYIKERENKAAIYLYAAEHFTELVEIFRKQVVIKIPVPGEPSFTTEKADVSRNVYFYSEEDLSNQEMASIDDAMHKIKLNPVFRGTAYLALHQYEKREVLGVDQQPGVTKEPTNWK